MNRIHFTGILMALAASGGFGFAATTNDESMLPSLLPPHGELGPTFWDQHGWKVAILTVSVVVVAVVLISWWRQTKAVVPEEPEALARRNLERLKNQKVDAKLVTEVSRILRAYLKAVYQLPDELTTTELNQALRGKAEINPELAADIGSFLRHGDEWKFAASPISPPLVFVENAMGLINRVEESRRMTAATEVTR